MTTSDGQDLERAETGTTLPAGEETHGARLARMSPLLELCEDGLVVVSPSTEVLYISPAVERITGFTLAELRGTKGMDLVHPEDRTRMAVSLARVNETAGATARVECRIVRPDGALRWLEVTAKNMTNDPAVGGLLANVRDVTERGAAIDALVASEARYRRIIETTSEGVWLTDAAGSTTFMNDRMAEMLGCDPGEAVSPADFLDDAGRRQLDAAVDRHRAGEALQHEVALLRRDGAKVWALLESSPVFDHAGCYDGALLMLMDVTSRKKAEEALRQRARIAALTADVSMTLTLDEGLSESLQRCTDAMVEHLDGALARIRTLSADGRTLELQASSGISTCVDGVDAHVAFGHGLVGLVAEQRAARMTNELQGDPRFGDAAWAAREGLTSFTGHALLVRGELVGVMAMFTRAPLMDAAAAALTAIAEQMAVAIRGKLAERATLGLEAQLRQAQRMEAVGRLAGGVAHDFNNMLSVILGYGQFIVDELKAGDPMQADVEEILKAGKRAADLTRQLLMFSRQQVLAPRILDVNDAVDGMERMFHRLLGEDIDLVLARVPVKGRVLADPTSLEQVIMNLVVNARDAMPTGGTLRIDTADVVLDEGYAREHVGAKTGPHVMLAIADSGTGMDAATMAHIFEPFFTTKDKTKGTGLGLSTVFGIVQQSGGHIAVTSELGRGTTFEVFLPRVDGAVDARAAVAPTAQLGSETVLLVEDDEQVRGVARGILRRHGYTIIEAKDAAAALLAAERHVGTIHLLLTDVVMPMMGGPELARRLAKTRPGMAVLFMSGYTDDSVVRHGVEAGGLNFLQKPLTVGALTQRVREILDGRRPTIAPPPTSSD